jgi:cystathionine beta-lyase/cystathionine gamma-synthase
LPSQELQRDNSSIPLSTKRTRVQARVNASRGPSSGCGHCSETLLRISTGIEDCEDLIADLENAFRVAAKG